MEKTNSISGRLSRFLLFFFMACSMLLFYGCKKLFDHVALREFKQVNLVANNDEYGASHIDPALINGWGIAFSTGGIAWVGSQGGHVSTVYDKDGNTIRPPVHIPSPAGPTGGNPTGVVFNNGGPTDFVLSNGGRASFLFVGLDGILSGWNQAAGNNALVAIDNSKGGVYTGLAIAEFNGQHYLYGANFRTGKIDASDEKFNPVSLPFNDPGLPAGYAPFNIQNIEGKLYVAYALVGPDGRDVPGVGNGFVSIFNPDGTFVKRFASRDKLNAPWGLAKAPASFFAENEDNGIESFTGRGIHRERQPAILVGNFGDGRINAYSLEGDFLGQLKTEKKVLEIDGLWAISFAPATATSIDPNRLYFAAGPDREEDGLFGYIIKD